MQLTVLGATGPTGQQVVKQALAAGHRITALVRDPARLPQREDERVTVVVGDATSRADVEKATRGSDALISALGPGKDFKSTLASQSAGPVLEAAAAAGVQRLIWLSALGAGASGRRQSRIQASASKLLMSKLMADKGTADDAIARSGLAWTIAMPVMLGNGAATGTYKALPLDSGTTRIGGKISRADLADALLTAATTTQWTRQRIILTH
ncbi:NAD(P)-dependent oxidoreductase [Streptacidiphilus rugosus]|uniref:NAD(P)-dependent oxidoreductase n=1 Tax=Streptacidiphilus rugosus TaxID=405783 RepID=UPI00056AB962|nr:NAD(P)H-binding protein [Streptacidiphilus rugosus]